MFEFTEEVGDGDLRDALTALSVLYQFLGFIFSKFVYVALFCRNAVATARRSARVNVLNWRARPLRVMRALSPVLNV